MNRKQYLVTIIFALTGGIIGGAISNQLLPSLAAFAEKSPSKHLKVIGAEKFVVTDTEGNVRAILGLIKEEPVLMMFGRDNSQPRLMIFDNKSCRVELSLRPNGEPRLNLFDEKSTLRTSVGAVTIKLPKTGKTKNLSSAMAVFDKKGNVLWSAPNFGPDR